MRENIGLFKATNLIIKRLKLIGEKDESYIRRIIFKR